MNMQQFLTSTLEKSLLIFFFCLPVFVGAQSEKEYIDLLAHTLQGQSEVLVENGRVDILTKDYAIEVERAGKWKNSIGQALWYAMQTNKQAGIILIAENAQDFKHFQRLNASLHYAGLNDRVRTWIYPQDFPGVELQRPSAYKQQSTAGPTDYWLTTSSKKRHRRSCRWYETSKGRYCSATEGVGASCCY